MSPVDLKSPRRLALVASGALALGGAGAVPAQAAPTKLARAGKTTLKLNPSTAEALTGLGVSVTPTGRAKAAKGGVAFPITGGSVDLARTTGRITHAGGLRLAAGRTRVTLTNPAISLGAKPALTVGVGDTSLRAFSLDLRKARIARDGLTVTVSNARVSLGAHGAKALNRAFGVKAFRKGLAIGTATTKLTQAEIAFAGGATRLALDPGAVRALQSLNITPAPAAPATAGSDGRLAFPITGGVVNARSLAGRVTHSGGLTLTRGSTVVTVSDFTVDTRRALLSVAVGDSRLDAFSLDLSAPEAEVGRNSVSVGNVTLKLTKAAADALNAAFETTAFTEGLTIGVATVEGTL